MSEARSHRLKSDQADAPSGRAHNAPWPAHLRHPQNAGMHAGADQRDRRRCGLHRGWRLHPTTKRFGYGHFPTGGWSGRSACQSARETAAGAFAGRAMARQRRLGRILGEDLRAYRADRHRSSATGWQRSSELNRPMPSANSRERAIPEKSVADYGALALPNVADQVVRTLRPRVLFGEVTLAAAARRLAMHPRARTPSAIQKYSRSRRWRHLDARRATGFVHPPTRSNPMTARSRMSPRRAVIIRYSRASAGGETPSESRSQSCFCGWGLAELRGESDLPRRNAMSDPRSAQQGGYSVTAKNGDVPHGRLWTRW